MRIEKLFKNCKTLCVTFGPEQTAEVRILLESLGFYLPAEIYSPLLLHEDKTASPIRGFASAIFWSLPEKELRKYRPDVRKVNFPEISPEKSNSGWYEARKFASP